MPGNAPEKYENTGYNEKRYLGFTTVYHDSEPIILKFDIIDVFFPVLKSIAHEPVPESAGNRPATVS
jgi:hypothetical protein